MQVEIDKNVEDFCESYGITDPDTIINLKSFVLKTYHDAQLQAFLNDSIAQYSELYKGLAD
jgi:hypothetical protein